MSKMSEYKEGRQGRGETKILSYETGAKRLRAAAISQEGWRQHRLRAQAKTERAWQLLEERRRARALSGTYYDPVTGETRTLDD
jgi:hypothetical protein